MLRYLTNKMDDKKQVSSSSYDETPKPKTVKMWACDVCQKTFPDYDEACRHEDQCRLKQEEEEEEEEASLSQQPSTDQQVVRIDLNSIKKSRSTKVHSSQVWSCDFCATTFADYQDACRHEEQCRAQQQTTRAAKMSTAEASKPVHPFFVKKNKSKETKQKRSIQQPPTDDSSLSSNPPTVIKTKKRKASKKTTKETTTKKAKSTVKQDITTTEVTNNTTNKRTLKTKHVPIADIFVSSKGAAQIMAEHKAAEFVAKRKVQAEQERQRQKRRQEQFEQKLKASSWKRAMDTTVQRRQPLIPRHVQFPNPSHVMPSCTVLQTLPDSNCAWMNQDLLSEARVHLVKTLQHQGNKSFMEEKQEDCPTLLPSHSKPPPLVSDPLQQALSDLLKRPEKALDSTEAWCDQYAIDSVPEDVCGAANKEIAQELIKFVDEWKVERGKAHERRAERQRALLKTKRKKRRYKEDDIWEDSDNEDGGLPSVCLLTGPCGSGKTNLVHAVARQSECVVLEINTTERRGGQALKNAIEEATQSDSSLDMLKKNSIVSDADPLCDSADEEEENTIESSIIVVLIDEVDIMFEEEGDSGFWTAMSTLTKKAKCPIFLTANTVPDSLASSHIRYLHLETSTPKPEECVKKIRRILKSEGLNRAERFAESSAETNKQLALIAQLCKCDLRRIINELQLFASAPPLVSDINDSPTKFGSSYAASASAADRIVPVIISDISPKEVSPHDLSLVTIKGRNFTLDGLETDLTVSIGSQLCPAAEVLNDSTILAVCPPCYLPSSVTDFGVIKSNGMESRTTRFAPVSICLYSHGRLLSRSHGNVTATTELCDGTPYTSLGRQWNIEYAFPPPRYGIPLANETVDSDDESKEAEFEGSVNADRRAPPELVAAETTTRRAFTKEEAAAILQKGIHEWETAHSEREGKSGSTFPHAITSDAVSAQELEALSSLTRLSSDASLLQDQLELGGVPYLAGVVPGFGSSLVNVASNNAPNNSDGNERKLLRDANARPPSLERMFALGWNENGCFFGNSDSYVRYPSSTYERKLLARTESLERGLPRALSTGTAATDPFQDDDEHHDEAAHESLAESIKLQDAPRRILAEDLFVRSPQASCILSLPDEFRRHVSDAGYSLLKEHALLCLPFAIESKASRMARLISDLFGEDSDPYANRLLCDVARVCETTIVPLRDRMEPSVFDDYLPMLCNIAMHECAAEHAFQQVRECDPETASALAGRGGRTTRRSGKTLERPHYFVSAMRSCSDGSVAKAICSELASEVLQYEHNE